MAHDIPNADGPKDFDSALNGKHKEAIMYVLLITYEKIYPLCSERLFFHCIQNVFAKNSNT